MSRSPRRSQSSVTIRTVAERAGVSAMTVSNVINNRPVREETREAVLTAIKALGYRPNIAAQRLARASSLTVGMLHGHPLGDIFAEILAGVLSAAPALGVDIVLEPVDLTVPGAVALAVERLVSRGAQGVVLPPIFAELYGEQRDDEAAPVPLVTLATGRAVAGIANFRIDECAAAQDMVRHLIATGRRRIVFIDGPDISLVSDERRRGYLAAMAEAGLVVRDEWLLRATMHNRDLLDACGALLAGAERPDAIFAWNDDYAALAMTAVHRRGLRIPQDIAVAGFDNSRLGAKLWPTLSSVAFPMAEMTEKALLFLTHAIADGTGEPAMEILPHTLVLRQSA